MPSLYNFLERAADLLISIVGSNSSSKRSPSPLHRYTSPSHSGHHCYPDEKEFPSSHSQRQSRHPSSIALAADHTQGQKPGSKSNYNNRIDNHQTVDSNRYVRSAQRARNVHWGTITEIPRGSSQPTAAGLNGYHHRRNSGKSSNYVYGTDSNSAAGTGRPKNSPSGSRSGSPDDAGNPGSTGSYKEQRYPQDWYSPSSSSSFQPQSTTTNTGPGSGSQECENQHQHRRNPRHRTNIPRKTILKPPTPLDDEMLIRNLWEMVVLGDQRLNYMYEFLSGVLLVGDDILDTMLRAGELSMFEEATRHANRMGEKQREKDFRPMKMPVPPRQHAVRERDLPVHATSEGRVRRGPAGPVFRGQREVDIVEEGEEG